MMRLPPTRMRKGLATVLLCCLLTGLAWMIGPGTGAARIPDQPGA